jgi:hypothetical protein
VKSGREAQSGQPCLYTFLPKNARAKRSELHVAAQESKFSYDSPELYIYSHDNHSFNHKDHPNRRRHRLHPLSEHYLLILPTTQLEHGFALPLYISNYSAYIALHLLV